MSDILLSPERLEIYKTLGAQIGDTPLVEIEGFLPNGNRLLVKQEFSNSLGGSHYDRVYLSLFREKEALGLLKPGMDVFETSSGSAGVSFAATGRELGYQCHVAIPAGGEKAREDAIQNAGAKIYFTPAEDYVNGFPAFIVRFKKEHRHYVFLNHSMGDIKGRGAGVNQTAVDAIHGIADEIIKQTGEVDHVISALGNGTNTLGLSERFSSISSHTEVSAFEMVSSGVGYRQKYGDDAYQNLLGGIDAKDFSRHAMPGTSYPGIDFPALREAVSKVKRVFLVTDEKTEAEYRQMTGNELPDEVIRLHHLANDAEFATYGRSTLASIAVAQQLASQTHNQKFVVIGYDKSDRYDPRPQPRLPLLQNNV